MVARNQRCGRCTGRTAARLGMPSPTHSGIALRKRGGWLGACALLALLSLHFVVAAAQAGWACIPLFWGACVVALGGCLWWVAKRQIGPAPAFLALPLYVTSPIAWHSGRAAPAALGLFVLLFTAVGVAHALRGPRKKWPPRLLLLAAVVAFTTLVQPLVCGLGLLLALPATVYLLPGRRRMLLLVFPGLVAVAAVAFSLRPALAAAVPGFFGAPQVLLPGIVQSSGALVAVAAALALWAARPRSRFFGNTAPLCAAAVLIALTGWAGAAALVWALPFALLFAAGVFADGFDSPGRRRWQALAIAGVAMQAAAHFLHF